MRRDVFQAIADPTRRAIIALIALQAMTPNAIADHFDSTRQAVSKHLRILTECELVKQAYSGRNLLLFQPAKDETGCRLHRTLSQNVGHQVQSIRYCIINH